MDILEVLEDTLGVVLEANQVVQVDILVAKVVMVVQVDQDPEDPLLLALEDLVVQDHMEVPEVDPLLLAPTAVDHPLVDLLEVVPREARVVTKPKPQFIGLNQVLFMFHNLIYL